jgi:radical SAM superfamily enzyme YgiQ (UPF0313 family)
MILVTFADLTHTGIAIDANNVPLSIGYVAAYALAHLGGRIRTRLFKYPAALSQFLASETPTIACFTNYMWNERLSCAFASQIKRHHPETIVVMGGPNYPVDVPEQQCYLERHPEIDFYVDGEGELAFVELFSALEAVNFEASRLRDSRMRIPSVHYVHDGQLVRGDMLPRILELDRVLPSPYTTGLLDEFFDDKLTPMIQTSRGCPYSCTFCHDGIGYMSKTRAFSAERVRDELAYIQARVKTAALLLADLNWGMFPGDIHMARHIAEIRQRGTWPRNIMCSTAKNQKERIIEMSRILGDLLQLGASIQSTDPEVLQNIKRTNISIDAIVKMAKAATASRTGSFTEIILALPGDTTQKHVKSVYDMLDAGIQDVRSFQFILLPGTEAGDTASRARFAYDTGFRVLARCFGRYRIYNDDVPVAEIQEICLGNSTMSREDYFDCRAFDLTVSIFNNGGVLKEFYRLAETLGVAKSDILDRIHQIARTAGGPFSALYSEFRESESRNFFESRVDLERFLSQPQTMDAYLRGEYGVNHIYKARTAALLGLFEQIVAIAETAVRAVLEEHDLLDSTLELYLRELRQVAVARKSKLTDLNYTASLRLHFDFPTIYTRDYLADPRDHVIEDGLMFWVQHSATQKADLTKYFTQFGQSQEGMAQFLQRNDTHLSAFLYREIDYAEPFVSTKISADPSIPADISLSGPIVDTVNAPESPSASESPMTSHVNPLRWFRT